MGIIFKNTLKNLFRSLTFWMLSGAVVLGVLDGVRELYFVGGGKDLSSWAFQSYVQTVSNSLTSTLLSFSMPLFAIVNVCLTQNRDYGDHFFEIEKAAGQSPLPYVAGRFLALISVDLLFLVLCHGLYLHLFTALMGGVEGFTLWEYLKDSTLRMLRIDLLVGAPCLLFFTGITFFFGGWLKSGVASAVGGVGYLLSHTILSLFFRWDAPALYFNYFSPVPHMLQTYFHYYDSPWFESCIGYFQTSAQNALLSASFLLTVTFFCMTAVYLHTRKRST